jgi:hypothetical protein
MPKLKVQIKGLEELKKKLQSMPRHLTSEIDQRIGLRINEAVGLAKRDAPADENAIRSGISGVREAPMQWLYSANAYHSVYMEFGTKRRYTPIPGVDPSEFKVTSKGSGKGFYDSILDWVKRKKITGSYSVKTKRRLGSKVDQQLEDEQTAFAIYLSILRHGVKPHPFFFKQIDVIEPKLLKDIESVINAERL